MKSEIWSRIDGPPQAAGIKHYELHSDRAKDTEASDVRTGAGLAFTVVKDHALDTTQTSYKDTTLSFITPNGVVAPAFLKFQSNGFLRSFYAGLLTIYGLSYIDTPCGDEGETLGLHGHLAMTPAEEMRYRTEWTDDSIESVINGKVWETRLSSKNLTLKRIIRCRYGENVLCIEDKVTNHGSIRQSLQILCHFNCGWLLLSPQTEILLSVKSVTPRIPHAAERLTSHLEIYTPQPGFNEQAYYPTLNSGSQGMSKAALVNAEPGWGIYERSDIIQLPNFIQWKNLGTGEYIMGLEVSNSFLNSRGKERAQGRLPFVEPGETRKYCFELGIVDGDAEASTLRAEIADCH